MRSPTMENYDEFVKEKDKKTRVYFQNTVNFKATFTNIHPLNIFENIAG